MTARAPAPPGKTRAGHEPHPPPAALGSRSPCRRAAAAGAAETNTGGLDMNPAVDPSPLSRAAQALALASIGGALALGACTSRPSGERYDPSRMDFNPGPAIITQTRHTGPFAAGSALSFDAALQPLDAARDQAIRLDTTHTVIRIAPGIAFAAWTFGNQVPGPTVHVKVGDRVRLSMTNRSDEPAPGGLQLTAPMMHSMDFHAAMVSPTDKYRSIAPGQTMHLEFTPNYPGVFMYRCGTPMVLEHIASGMYGVVVVAPRDGYPTRADREYVIVQSEFYTKPDPQHRSVGTDALHVLDGERLRRKAPTYTVFNGRYNGMVTQPLIAKPGERVRLYVLNAGPSDTSSFHVVGAIFDRVWLDGNPDNQLRGMQTVLLGSSGSAIVAFVVPEAGAYVMVDHQFANASQGAVGVIDAGAHEESTIEHHNIPASATPTDAEAIQGKLDFESKCLACHTLGHGAKLGPDLLGVTQRRSDAWLRRWLASPEAMVATDADARALRAHYPITMPDQNLSDSEIRRYVRYFHWADEASKQRDHAMP
ncbi:multicopper oxidase domain-containing protein [Burkholderia pseudomallei]|uniref:multicopper oxidase domain-containing protein n=1 Tax=Burkholderia pseudomallei TaxID=28450 RepID=UPI00031EAB14|nr:multicopper oxidase domain-containing protein [Burkholderia pseudomallei]MDV2165092.1 multicopper oxidase domain-containing protein [Burkholderia pseudomallei]MDV2238534.1 multicopper oxidase domain-containing protein [Burkholderia pseudomallei]OMQ54969.1 cytochrome C [Burkholderia pseudomallei]OMQ59639.1 cytochrome C [Burkholderia pseudomallei]OMQ85492.1 cytochrome C [Burkholderia pseudomallei]